MLEMVEAPGWEPELIATQASEGIGAGELWDAILRHDAYLRESGELAARRRNALAHRVRAFVLGRLEGDVTARIAGRLGDFGQTPPDPYALADAIASELG